MLGPVILPLDQAVSAVASAERLAQAGVSSNEVRLRTDMHVYAVMRDAAGVLHLGHTSHSSHASHASHVSSSGGGGSTIPIPVDADPIPVVLTAPSAPASIATTPGDGVVDVSWAPALSDDGGPITYKVTLHPGEVTVSIVTSTTARFDGLVNGTAYWFTISAGNSIGQGPSVTTDTVTPLAPQLEGHTPVIVGEPAVQQPLKVEATGWAAGTTLRYQWQANGRDIDGAVGTTFRPTMALVGERISVVVTGANPAYALGARATSAKTVKVARVGASTITGKANVGSVLRAHTGKWTAGTKFRFTWFVGGKKVRTSGAALTVKPTYAGKSIVVRVTGKRTGYDTFVVASARTPKVRG